MAQKKYHAHIYIYYCNKWIMHSPKSGKNWLISSPHCDRVEDAYNNIYIRIKFFNLHPSHSFCYCMIKLSSTKSAATLTYLISCEIYSLVSGCFILQGYKHIHLHNFLGSISFFAVVPLDPATRPMAIAKPTTLF